MSEDAGSLKMCLTSLFGSGILGKNETRGATMNRNSQLAKLNRDDDR